MRSGAARWWIALASLCTMTPAMGSDRAQDSDPELAKRVDDALRADLGWSASESAGLRKAILAGFAAVPSAPAQRKDEALRSLPTLLSWWEPGVQPIFPEDYAHLNERYPVPPVLREREFYATANLFATVIEEGLRRSPPTEAEARLIRSQIDAGYDLTKRLLRAGVSGDEAEKEIEWAVESSRSIAHSSVGHSFTLGMDRPLTKEEMEEALGTAQTEAAKLNGLVLPRAIPNWERMDEAILKARRERAEHVALVCDAGSAFGRCRWSLHPQAHRALGALEAVQGEYKEWRRLQSRQSQDESKARREAILAGLQEEAKRRAASEPRPPRTSSFRADPEPVSNGMSPARRPATPQRDDGLARLRIAIVVLAVLIVVAAIVVPILRRRRDRGTRTADR
ncbi:MAG: hypothetical protein HYY17_11200 [Planctomycetes bacterium]|nr:hypothetical protein [Planctomycetota bacterium]